MAYRITLNTLLEPEPDSTIVSIAFNTDRDATTGANKLRRDPDVDFPGTDELLTVWGAVNGQVDAEHVSYDREGNATRVTPLSAPSPAIAVGCNPQAQQPQQRHY